MPIEFGSLVRRLQVRLRRRGQAAVVGHDQLHVRMRGDVGGEHRHARGGIGVRLAVDLDVVDLQAGLLQCVDRTLRAEAARRLGQKPPDHRTVALLQVQLADGRGTEQIARVVEVLTDVAEPLRLVRLEQRRQLGVLAGDDDSLALGLIDPLLQGGVTGVTHHGDAGRIRGDRSLELAHHRLGIPVRPHVLDVGPEIRRSLLRAVVHVDREDTSRRPAREEDDLLAGAPLPGVRRSRPLARGPEEQGRDEGDDRDHRRQRGDPQHSFHRCSLLLASPLVGGDGVPRTRICAFGIE